MQVLADMFNLSQKCMCFNAVFYKKHAPFVILSILWYDKFLDFRKEVFTMAKATAGKNYWVLLLMILAGIVLGGFIGQLTANVPALSWLNYGQTFGLSTPLILDLGILVLTFGLTIKITIAGLLGIVLAILIYRFL